MNQSFQKPLYGDINVSTLDLEMMIHGIRTICAGLTRDVLELNAKGIMANDPTRSDRENAYDFIDCNYDLIQGVVTLIEACTNVIGDALTNNDIILVPGSEILKKQSEAQ